jgi:hypothetical protein
MTPLISTAKFAGSIAAGSIMILWRVRVQSAGLKYTRITEAAAQQQARAIATVAAAAVLSTVRMGAVRN